MDAWGVVKVGFGYLAATKPYSSGRPLRVKFADSASSTSDWRRIGKTDNRPGAIRGADRANVQVWSFGGHFLHAVKTGAGTPSISSSGVSDKPVTGGAQSHSGSAITIEGGFQPKGLDATEALDSWRIHLHLHR